MMSYWDFFPAESGWGRMSRVGLRRGGREPSRGVEPGMRVYGYSAVVLSRCAPAQAGADGFIDGSAHRAPPSTYQRYRATARSFLPSDTEDLQLLLRPLFFTSFLIDDQLVDDGLAARGPIVISSASSKTAIGAAFLLAQREGAELIGLTSAAQRRVRRRPRHLRPHLDLRRDRIPRSRTRLPSSISRETQRSAPRRPRATMRTISSTA